MRQEAAVDGGRVEDREALVSAVSAERGRVFASPLSPTFEATDLESVSQVRKKV